MPSSRHRKSSSEDNYGWTKYMTAAKDRSIEERDEEQVRENFAPSRPSKATEYEAMKDLCRRVYARLNDRNHPSKATKDEAMEDLCRRAYERSNDRNHPSKATEFETIEALYHRADGRSNDRNNDYSIVDNALDYEHGDGPSTNGANDHWSLYGYPVAIRSNKENTPRIYRPPPSPPKPEDTSAQPWAVMVAKLSTKGNKKFKMVERTTIDIGQYKHYEDKDLVHIPDLRADWEKEGWNDREAIVFNTEDVKNGKELDKIIKKTPALGGHYIIFKAYGNRRTHRHNNNSHADTPVFENIFVAKVADECHKSNEWTAYVDMPVEFLKSDSSALRDEIIDLVRREAEDLDLGLGLDKLYTTMASMAATKASIEAINASMSAEIVARGLGL